MPMQLKNERNDDYPTTIASMPIGSIGISKERNIYYRISETAVCLNFPGKSFSGNADKVDNFYVRLFEPGTKLEFTVTD